MDFLQFLKRHFLVLFLSTLIFTLIGVFLSFQQSNVQAKTTMFLTLATQDSSDPEQAEVAATYFGETVMGWFRNPVFTNAIVTELNANGVSLSALKQERQNMLVEIRGDDKELTKTVADITLTKLRNDVDRYNKASKSSFVVIDQGRTTRISSASGFTLPLAAALFGFFFALMLMALKEFLWDEVSSSEEVEEILGVKALDFLNDDWEKNDLTLLSVAIQKASPLVVLAGVNIATEILAVALAHKQSFFGEKIALVDGDMKKRTLQETLGLSSRMKNLKGHTDAFKEDKKEIIKTSMIVQNTLDDNLKFLPAGKGQHFLTQVFANLAQEMKTLIHTQLPENSEVLRLTNATLILVVEIGKTKRKNLKRIREVWKEDLKLVIVE